MGPTAETVRDVETRSSSKPDSCKLLPPLRSKSPFAFKQATWTDPCSYQNSEKAGKMCKCLQCKREYNANAKTHVGIPRKARSGGVLRL